MHRKVREENKDGFFFPHPLFFLLFSCHPASREVKRRDGRDKDGPFSPFLSLFLHFPSYMIAPVPPSTPRQSPAAISPVQVDRSLGLFPFPFFPFFPLLFYPAEQCPESSKNFTAGRHSARFPGWKGMRPGDSKGYPFFFFPFFFFLPPPFTIFSHGVFPYEQRKHSRGRRRAAVSFFPFFFSFFSPAGEAAAREV